jgi:hypothetical protein
MTHPYREAPPPEPTPPPPNRCGDCHWRRKGHDGSGGICGAPELKTDECYKIHPGIGKACRYWEPGDERRTRLIAAHTLVMIRVWPWLVLIASLSTALLAAKYVR